MPDIDTLNGTSTPEPVISPVEPASATSPAEASTSASATPVTPPPAAAPQKQKKRDEKYFLVPVIIQAENTLFKIPRHYLTRSSIFFRDMFSLDEGTGLLPEDQDGSSDKRPVRLPAQIKKEEFKFLLRVLCPLTIPPNYDAVTQEGWIAVLKLSNMWQIHDARKMAIDKLTNNYTIPAIDKLALGKEYHVPSWIKTAYTQLVQQTNALTPEEAKKVGFDSYIGITSLRERKNSIGSIENEVATTFKVELDNAEYHDKEFAAAT